MAANRPTYEPMDPIRRKMRNLVAMAGVVGDPTSRFTLGNAMRNVFELRGPEASPRLTTESSVDLGQLEMAAAANELRLDDPEAFGRFLDDARGHSPDDQFRSAVAEVVQGHLRSTLMQIRLGVGRTSRETIEGLHTLAEASRRLGGAAAETGEQLRNVVGHIFAGTARAYVRALDAGLMREPGAPDADLLSRSHRTGTADEVQADWTTAFVAITECPLTSFGTQLRRFLLERAQAHLAFALQDLAAVRARTAPDAVDPEFEATYAVAWQRIAELQASTPTATPAPAYTA